MSQLSQSPTGTVPITLHQIFHRLTAPDVMLQERAYALVALNTVIFHPTVKLFFFEHTPLHKADGGSISSNSNNNNNNNNNNSSSGGSSGITNHDTTNSGDATAINSATKNHTNDVSHILAENKRRRELLLKSIASFFAQRNSAVVKECRWETIAVLGELCRLESLIPLRPGGYSSNSPHAIVGGGSTAIGAQEEIVQKINSYARANLEFLALLPWFTSTLREIIAEGTNVSATTNSTHSNNQISSSGLSTGRPEMRRPTTRTEQTVEDENDMWEMDEDVCIAIKDLLAALPTVKYNHGANNTDTTTTTTTTTTDSTVEWTSDQLEHAHDLMFLDASTSMMHLIPLVSRGDDTHCANCDIYSNSLVRCGSCRSTYYCSTECQRAHWRAAHSTACLSYKRLVEASNLELQQQQQRKKNKNKKTTTVEVPEVPLEPSLFFTTRRYMYVHRDASFADVSFNDYFMKYTVRGV